MATLTPQFLQRFQIAKEDFKKSVCCQVDTLFATFLNELKANLHSFPCGEDGRAHHRSPMLNGKRPVYCDFEDANRFCFCTGSSRNSQSSRFHYHHNRPDYQQRSVVNGNNPHVHFQNLSTNKKHQRPMLQTQCITSALLHPPYQQKTLARNINSAHFINQEFGDDIEGFEAGEDEDEEEDEEEEEEGSGHYFVLKGGSEEDYESEEVSSENELSNHPVSKINGFANKRLKTEHYVNDVDEDDVMNNNADEDKKKEEKEAVEENDDNEVDDDGDPSEEMVVHVAPDEAILNAGSRKSPPTMLTPQTRMPSPLRIGHRLACPLSGCTRSYRQMKQYTSHMWTHRGIKPYRCTWADGPDGSIQCQYMSEHPRNVIQHVRLMHFCIPRTIKEQRALVS